LPNFNPDDFRGIFGEEDSKIESYHLLGQYKYLYYEDAPFVSDASKKDVYLIRGRRGSGKTALAVHLGSYKESHGVPEILSEEKISREFLLQISKSASDNQSNPPQVSLLRDGWNLIIWSILFIKYSGQDEQIRKASVRVCAGHTCSDFDQYIATVLKSFQGKLELPNFWQLATQFSTDNILQAAVPRVLAQVARQPITISIDTAEHYNINNSQIMNSFAALIEAASLFESYYSHKYPVYVKVYLPDESYSALVQRYISNPAKHVRNVVLLRWRPRDLLKCVMHRLAHNVNRRLDWREVLPIPDISRGLGSDEVVRTKMWNPIFGEYVKSRIGITENSWVYVLRHTQLQPRQVIRICNEIILKSIKAGEFPKISAESIRSGIQAAEHACAEWIINSFKEVFPGFDMVVDALKNGPAVIKPTELRSEILGRAAQIMGRVPKSIVANFEDFEDFSRTYSKDGFLRVLIQSGILGRVVSRAENQRIIRAQFQYNTDQDISIHENEECVVHPMFCQFLNRTMDSNDPWRVHPFAEDEA